MLNNSVLLLLILLTSMAGSNGKPQRPSVDAESGSLIAPIVQEDAAHMARYIVQMSIELQFKYLTGPQSPQFRAGKPTVGYPFASVVSVSDGAPAMSTGIPYVYLTAFGIVQDLEANPKTSLTMTLAQKDYCQNSKLDPEDPKRTHVVLTGKIVKLQNGTGEKAIARELVFAKHPIMSSWPEAKCNHQFFFAKIDIRNILIRDSFGGATSVVPKNYYNAMPH